MKKAIAIIISNLTCFITGWALISHGIMCLVADISAIKNVSIRFLARIFIFPFETMEFIKDALKINLWIVSLIFIISAILIILLNANAAKKSGGTY